MQPPFPCPTATWRNDTYDAISPSRPELSVAGKTVVIIGTGTGSGIGRETARAFAAAGAAHVALLGRTEASLVETASLLPASAHNSVHVADVTKLETLEAAAAAIGLWHVVVLASGYCPKPNPVSGSDAEEWQKGYQVIVLGTALTAKAFLPTVRGAAFLGITSDTSLLPPTYLPGLAAYVSIKLAQAKVYEFLAAENPDVFVATVHPGMIDTNNFRATGASPDGLPMDTAMSANSSKRTAYCFTRYRLPNLWTHSPRRHAPSFDSGSISGQQYLPSTPTFLPATDAASAQSVLGTNI
ncbi:hypothetical protein B0H66DRAFT_627248 [Apodospora peruviana]|uniref:Uncharacterized protein n=1 Tax=Apodospora peruviana TaxID=516989 RepID=A0AAE0HXD8_9PEZI|nr:hypothetical protein B0H66DRAFT_627248 [Apodospora peruviana]